MTLQEQNEQRWKDCKINPVKDAEFDKVAKRLTAAKERYKAVETKTGVPWWFIAVVHERESGQDWKTSLAQGDPWNRKSTHVPKGRGPFNSWEEAAIDALVDCAPYAARNKDWSVGASLALLEGYNGLGYYKRGIPSPYMWAGTNQYSKGKYVADGVFDPNHVDQQLGVAGLLIKMGAFKPTSVPVVKPAAEAGSAGVIAVVGTGIATQFTNHIPEIIVGTAVLATLAWLVVRWYKNKTLKESINVSKA